MLVTRRIGMSRWILACLLACCSSILAAQPSDIPFRFRPGDRVVLVGGTYVERMQTHGYLETLVTASAVHPLTFRNLGWSGDDVWGTARAVFGQPADGFRRLLGDIKLAQPTVIVLAYGANEAHAGVDGLDQFRAGLEKLLDQLAESKARLVLLVPPRRQPAGPLLPSPESYNRNLRRYAEVMLEIARRRKIPCINFYDPLGTGGEKPPRIRDQLTENSVHFTAYGYWRTAPRLAAALGIEPWKWRVHIDASSRAYDAVGTTLGDCDAQPSAVRFAATDRALPFSPPPGFSPRGAKMLAPHALLRITGLEPGDYGLSIDGRPAILADHKQWAGGVYINLGRYSPQTEELRQAIIEKNQLFFHRYRPQNETYLFLFRKHEQGNNAVEVPRFDKLVEGKDAEIAALRVPRQRTYRLIRVK